MRPDGPPDLAEADFAHIPHWGTRQLGWKEYQRTIQEFRRTGSVQKKGWKDFAHFVHPRDTPDHLLAAHRRAIWQIEQWRDEQEEAERRHEIEEAKARLAEAVPPADEPLDDAEETFDEEDDFTEADEDENDGGPETSSPFADALQDARDRLEGLKNRAALAGQPAPALPPPVPQLGKTAGLLRGVSFEPDVPSRNARFEPAIPQLDIAPRPERLPPSDDQTEALLNAMIGECHFLMRAVAFPSMCHAHVADDRLHWVTKAMELATTGATVAKAVARLRHGPSIRESHQKITVENKVAVVQGGGGCANP